MTQPLVRDLAAEGVLVRFAYGVLNFSTHVYYAWLKQPVGDRELQDVYVINALIGAYGDEPAFGYRFVACEYREAVIDGGGRRVWRLCSQQQLWSRRCVRAAGASTRPCGE
jgi:putative transposase